MPEETIRVLLDARRLLKPLFDAVFEVATVQEQGWAGRQNGELLLAVEQRFDVFVTMDRNLPYQQNLEALDLAVIVIRTWNNAFTHVAPLMPKVNEAIRDAQSGAATIVGA